MLLRNKKYIDISMELNEETLVWVEDQAPKLVKVARQPTAPVNFTWLNFGAHAGTHIDAPFYLYNEQWTCDQIPLDRLIGVCQVLDLTKIENNIINANDLKQYEIRQQRLLLKTKNSYDKLTIFHNKHIILSPDAAEYLVEVGVKTLGYDYQSFEKGGENIIHHIFLKENITLIDNLRLMDAENKDYYLFCLPIKVTGIDATPARALLFDLQ